MAKLPEDFTQAVNELSKEKLLKILFRFAKKNKEVYDYINVEYVSDKEAEENLYEDTLQDVMMELNFYEGTALIGYKEGFGLINPDFNKLSEDERFDLTKELLKGSCYPYCR
ncbi:MAG: hypothetical protein HY738_10255 [Bacteroidia bacterium]|nr:hypothetical protein [Bacteroidia bacterium]